MNCPWPSRTTTSVVTRSTLRRITSGDCGVSTPSGFLSCACCANGAAAPPTSRASATKYFRMFLLYAPAGVPADNGTQVLEDGFILLERSRDLVGSPPAVRVQT